MIPAETAGKSTKPVRRSITFAIRATAEPACHRFLDCIAIRSIDFLSLLFDRSGFGKLLLKDFDEPGRGAQPILEDSILMQQRRRFGLAVRPFGLGGALPLAARRHALTSASAPSTE